MQTSRGTRARWLTRLRARCLTSSHDSDEAFHVLSPGAITDFFEPDPFALPGDPPSLFAYSNSERPIGHGYGERLGQPAWAEIPV